MHHWFLVSHMARPGGQVVPGSRRVVVYLDCPLHENPAILITGPFHLFFVKISTEYGVLTVDFSNYTSNYFLISELGDIVDFFYF